jgi:tetratricopeptide (TPR) repeat protein
MKKAEGRMQNAEAPLPPPAARLAAQSQIGNRKSQILWWLMVLLLVLGTVAIYWPAMRCGFINYDDDFYVTSNVHVQQGLTWGGMKWAWSSPVAGNWHPLTVWSHMVDCQLFGLKPWGHHLISVLLHALNAGLVFVLLQRMTGAVWRSLLVAALFALHPLRVESVAWVAERKDVLSGFFGLLSLLAYARYAQGRRQKAEGRRQNVAGGKALPGSAFYLLSLLFLALGLMSKPMLVTWPFVMLLLDYWPLGRMQNAATSDTHHAPRTTFHVSRTTPLPLLLEKIPFFALAAGVSVVTFLVQKQAGAVMGAESLSIGARAGNALISYGRYLGKLFWPAHLAVYYPRPGQWPMGEVLLGAGLILVVSALVCMRRRRCPYSLMGWLWFVGTLVPVIGLVQAGGQAMADRYTYLPTLGVLILTIWGAHELVQGKAEVRGQRTEDSDTQHVSRSRVQSQILLWVVGGAAVVLCMALTREQLGYWKDGETLFRHALEVTENNQIAYKVLGDALDKKGQTGQAINQFREAIRVRPGYADAHSNLGVALAKDGQTDEAIREFQEAIRLNSNHANAHYNLGIALDKKGQMEDALCQFQEAVRLNPAYIEAHYNLGIVLSRKGQMDEAIRHFQEAIQLKPDYAEAHNDLGICLGRKGQMEQALHQFQEATRLKPGYPEAHLNLGLLLSLIGQTVEAIRQFEAALKVKPDYAEAHNYLGSVLSQQGRTGEAIREFQEALKLKPDYADARKNLNAVLASKGEAAKQTGASTNR